MLVDRTIKNATTFALIFTSLIIFNQRVIACSSVPTPPESVCIELENHNPESQRFKTCMFKLLYMSPGEYLKRYDPCLEGPILPMKEYSSEIKKIVLEIEKEYSKKTEKENNGVK